jgi:nitrite reductase (NO-forming)
MFTRRAALISAAATALMLATPALAADDLKLPRQKIELVAPPFVHAHEQATKQGSKIVEFTLTIEEKKVVIDEKGTTFQAMTFNGSMPGPMMVVHEGDYVETTLVNPATNSMPHNIDFHSATGALGGGALTLVNPGEQDMYVQRDEKGNFKTYESAGESYNDTVEVMRKLTPTHVVFNGKVGALTGRNALTANVGENVLIVHSQANRDRRPTHIGGHGDSVWESCQFPNAPETGN